MNLYRSLSIERPPDESLLKLLERLAEEGYLQNNLKLDVQFHCSRNSRFFEVICSMKNLETLKLFEDDLTLDSLTHVFQSCPKLIELHICTQVCITQKMDNHLKNQLKSGFQRLRWFDLNICFTDSHTMSEIQEMLT